MIPTTNEIRIETSSMCNYKCKMCPHSNGFKRNSLLMDFNMYKHIIDKVYNEVSFITELTLSGIGEPFINKDIIKQIKYGKDLGYNIHLLSNGSLLTEEIIRKICDFNIKSFRISFHTNNENDYNDITGTIGHYYKVLENINLISKYKKDTNLIITSDFVEYNEDKDTQKVEQLKKMFNNVDLLEIWKVHNWVSWGNYRTKKQIKSTCGRPFRGPIQVQADGSVIICGFDVNGELEIGNLNNQTLEEIYSSKKFMNIYNIHKEGKIYESNLICKHCDQLQDQHGIVIYNSKYSENERIGKLSTTYSEASIE